MTYTHFCPYCMKKAFGEGRCLVCGCDLHRRYFIPSPRAKKKNINPKGPQRYVRTIFGTSECVWCGTTDNPSIHHIHPLGKGGDNSKLNRVTMCRQHHQWLHHVCDKQRSALRSGFYEYANKL